MEDVTSFLITADDFRQYCGAVPFRVMCRQCKGKGIPAAKFANDIAMAEPVELTPLHFVGEWRTGEYESIFIWFGVCPECGTKYRAALRSLPTTGITP